MERRRKDSSLSTYRMIRRQVTTLELAPGSELSTGELARTLGLPSAEVADVLGRLGREQLVVPVGDGLWRVAPLTVEGARELFHLRSLLESEAAGLAAKGDVDLDELRRLERWAHTPCNRANSTSVAAWIEANADFHVSVVRAGGNCRLAFLLEQVFEELARYLHLTLLVVEGEDAVDEEHVRMLDALKRGDPDQARAAAKAHVAVTQRLVLDALLAADREAEIVTLPRSRHEW